MQKVVVTGSSGYLGRWAAEELVKRGFEVHGIARNHRGSSEITVHKADLNDVATISKLVRQLRPTHLLLCAWLTTPGVYWNDLQNENWVSITEALANTFWEAGGERVVLAGTCAEYDWSDPILVDRPVGEDDALGEPATLYGRSKRILAERLKSAAAARNGGFAVGRLFFPMGIGERPERFLPSVVQALLRGAEVKIGPGDQLRDIMDVRDAGAALGAILDSHVSGAVNIGSGLSCSLAELANHVGLDLGRPELIRVGALERRANEPITLIPSIDRLAGQVGYKAQHDLDDIVDSAIAYWREAADLRKAIE